MGGFISFSCGGDSFFFLLSYLKGGCKARGYAL